MRSTLLVPVLALAAAALPSTAFAGAVDGYAPGELIVKFRQGVAPAERADALRARGARVERTLPLPRPALVRLPDRAGTAAAAAAFERDPRVAWAEPNAYREGGAVPGDQLFSQQWGLHNTGQEVEGAAGAADADIDAPEAWERTTGSPDVRVAVVDSGINFAEPDLAPNRLVQASGASMSASGEPPDWPVLCSP